MPPLPLAALLKGLPAFWRDSLIFAPLLLLPLLRMERGWKRDRIVLIVASTKWVFMSNGFILKDLLLQM
jgi:hypothetical protein